MKHYRLIIDRENKLTERLEGMFLTEILYFMETEQLESQENIVSIRIELED